MIKPTILIVEDEPEVLDINERMLKRRGYNVITAQNVKESFVRLSEVIPDMLILDIMLPDGSGCDICRKFREKSDNPVIFLTGKNEVADKVEGLGLGADYYLTKPYTRQRLTDTLDRVIEKRKKRLFVPLLCGREIHRIDIYDVIYTESKNHSVEVHLKSGKSIKTRTSLTDIKKLFDKSDEFIPVGASYIVNLRCIQSILQSELIMTNGQSIPVPRRIRNDVKEQYFNFYSGEATKK